MGKSGGGAAGRASGPLLAQTGLRIPYPKGPRTQIMGLQGRIWALKPYDLGHWTLRVIAAGPTTRESSITWSLTAVDGA